MIPDKETVKKARRTPPESIHRALGRTLVTLDATPPRRVAPRWAFAATAAVLLIGIAVTLPALRRGVPPQDDRVLPVGATAPAGSTTNAPGPTATPASPSPELEGFAPFSVPLEKLPKSYPPELAAQHGDYVDVHGTISNADAMMAFRSAVDGQKPAAIRIVRYTVEGDPIIADVVYDGERFTLREDASRDQYGGERTITKKTYQYLREYTDDRQELNGRVILTNEGKTAGEGFEEGANCYLLYAYCIPSGSTMDLPEPTDTVAYYFGRWAAKDTGGMQSVLHERKRGDEYELEHLVRLDLLQCTEKADLADADAAQFAAYAGAAGVDGFYKTAVVNAKFEIEMDEATTFDKGVGIYDWTFYLVKETKGGPWLIIDCGG